MAENAKIVIPDGHDVISYGIVISAHIRRRTALREDMMEMRSQQGLSDREPLRLSLEGVRELVGRMERRLG